MYQSLGICILLTVVFWICDVVNLFEDEIFIDLVHLFLYVDILIAGTTK